MRLGMCPISLALFRNWRRRERSGSWISSSGGGIGGLTGLARARRRAGPRTRVFEAAPISVRSGSA